MKILYPIEQKYKGKIKIKNSWYSDFTSNDTLGLSQDEELIHEVKLFFQDYGMGSGGSRLLGGDRNFFHDLEEEIAIFKGSKSALLFNSGYHANTGIFSVFYNKQDAIFADRLIHASLIDGIQLSKATLYRYSDTHHLQILLETHRHHHKQAVLVTESIFSMDGTRACLADLIELKNKFNTKLWVDEAHATGLYSENGSGLTAPFMQDIDLVVGTFGKALGGYGAYVIHEKQPFIDKARSFIFSTSLPLPVVYWNQRAIHKVKSLKKERKNILELAKLFREEGKKRGLNLLGDTHIVPWLIGDKARMYAEKLREGGIWVQAIGYPTVPKKKERIRFSFSVFHTKKDIDQIFSILDGN